MGNSSIDCDNTLHGERSIWWNLYHNSKPLALTQGCSTRFWHNKGVKYLMDILENDNLITWEDLSSKYNLPALHKRTYNMIRNACKTLNLPRNTHVHVHRYLSFLWKDGSPLPKIKANVIYNSLNHDTSVIDHVNTLQNVHHNPTAWYKIFENLWKSPIPPKIKCFRWQLLLNRLPIRNNVVAYDLCFVCNKLESA